MLKVEDVSVVRGKTPVLNNISFALSRQETLAIVGESGAGKSTLVAAILGLVKLSNGSVTWNQAPVRESYPALVMQEPRSAFNPSLNLRKSVIEPLLARKFNLSSDRLERLCAGLELAPDILDRRCDEVSIGQAQRVGILRALIASPPLILFDEPLSALDAVTQKHTARLIADLQKEEGFAALIVTHDLGYAAAHADQVAVLNNGRIEEISRAADFIRSPKTVYGLALRDAAFALGAVERVA